jgi:hypothetical protein
MQDDFVPKWPSNFFAITKRVPFRNLPPASIHYQFVIMTLMQLVAALLALLMPGVASPQTVCDCDPARPETLNVRQCSLCLEAEKQPLDQPVFFLKDTNPRKPNRWLALPRAHTPGNHPIEELSPEQRAEIWTATIGKAKELFGDEWGLAYNGSKVRTQCHAHIHIGRLIQAPIETERFVVVNTPAEIPMPKGEGVWVHPQGQKFHVHLGEQTTETVLVR